MPRTFSKQIDIGWKDSRNMNPWPQGCQRLMTAMIGWIEFYTSDFREPPATPVG
jgi:hypothetical protein